MGGTYRPARLPVRGPPATGQIPRQRRPRPPAIAARGSPTRGCRPRVARDRDHGRFFSRTRRQIETTLPRFPVPVCIICRVYLSTVQYSTELSNRAKWEVLRNDRKSCAKLTAVRGIANSKDSELMQVRGHPKNKAQVVQQDGVVQRGWWSPKLSVGSM
ncbi:hypothetical protein GW17_00018370 [Ensete ventricosum]|nr:hypothetical protein GW17_00018370 [Ensete ventricosum]